MNRFTQVNMRYHVAAPDYLLETAETKAEALSSAVWFQRQHRRAGDNSEITVFDTMAHKGKPCLFDSSGVVLEKRGDA